MRNMNVIVPADIIKQCAAQAGFDMCGVARARNFYAEEKFFNRWLERGFGGGLEYLRRNVDKRFAPGLLVDGARTVIVCAVNYKNDTSLEHSNAGYPKVASYARTRDYHMSIKQMLLDMAARLAGRFGEFGFRAFTDSAPVLEKRWAVEAGLGWIGRNSLLITPRFGSFVLLGELIVDFDVEQSDTLSHGAGCGNCRRCVDACPAGAITEGEGIDARKCISRLTVEKETDHTCTADKKSLDGWIFGCDVCQAVCPHNQHSPLFGNERFAPIFDPRQMSVRDWKTLSEEQFLTTFGSTPLVRSGLCRLQRNLPER